MSNVVIGATSVPSSTRLPQTMSPFRSACHRVGSGISGNPPPPARLLACSSAAFRGSKLSNRLPVKPARRTAFICRSSVLTPALKTSLDKVVTSHKVILFMKGTKDFPQCGFSNTVVQILNSLNVPFETINILENEMLRQAMKEYSSWPTFPQLYIDGEFFGGCDITVEAYQSGELQEMVEKAMCS